MLEAGTVISGTYRLERLLGRGGMGEVWQARHLLLDEPRAIKIILTSIATDPAVRQRFIKGEASAALRLEYHPNIVRIYELGQHENIPYIIMEYVPGGPAGSNLADLLERQRRLAPAQAGEMLEQLAAGLEVAHRRGLVHRDIKPANILLGAGRDNSFRYMLSDFGLTKDLQADLKMTAVGVSVGTPAYMSPEQAEGVVEPRSDIYSLAVVMYEALTGQLPFKGIPILQLAQHAANPPPPLRSIAPDIPARLEAVILKALAKNPHDRYATATEFGLAYRQALSFELPAADATVVAMVVPTTPVPSAAPPGPAFSTTRLGPTNLPHPTNRLVGRETETAALSELLEQPQTRLVTLTGPGGTGKTRLALQVAAGLRAFFHDGVFLVNLAALTDPALVLPAIAQALDLREGQDLPPLARLQSYLGGKQILLVLDNFEQVVAASNEVAALLGATSKLKIVVTSQVALRIYGENEHTVGPLALPDLPVKEPPEKVGQYGAVALFMERARAVQPDIRLDATNAAAAAEICVRLDGLPLAIELAAARSKLLAPPALLARLTNRLDLLVGGARNLDPRQQTMRGALDWSYDLLSPDEKLVFGRLAVFTNGWTFEAAESILDLDEPANPGPAGRQRELAGRPKSKLKILDVLASLLDKSMLRQEQAAGKQTEPRLKLLETVREYAQERLAESGQVEALRQRHAEYFVRLAERIEPELQGPQQGKWLERLEAEHANLRAALEWLLKAEPAGPNLELAARLGGAIAVFWEKRGHLGEGRRWLEAIGAKYRAEPPDRAALLRRAKVIRGAAILAHTQGDHEPALKLHEEGIALLRQAGDKAGLATALNDMGWEALRRGDYGRATALAQESLALGRELDDKRAMAAPLFQLGTLAMLQKNYSRSAFYFQESLPLWRALGDRNSIAAVLTFLGFGAWLLGDYKTAGELLRESLSIRYETEDRLGMHVPLAGLAGLAASRGRLEVAARLLGAEEALREAAGAPIQPGFRDLYHRASAPVRGRLNEAAIAAAYAEGRRMSLAQVIELALQEG